MALNHCAIPPVTAYDVAAMRRLGFWNATGISRKTKDDEVEAWLQDEVAGQLRMVLDSTSGTGVVHESVNSWDEGLWTRSWFGWASGLLGELILRIEGGLIIHVTNSQGAP
ncbi:hypothetical protein MGG_17521 [Pyricularia oryzae 70-15]|uniref:Uncharacterized protein n=1 Tax=Pyricularia oryzae (strain 70-15 / ATCC MYA-4617 / FGSC 8958) TaxID=242507 RepID=G4NE48_PYRO7|nr:uncharacterized protein MGG_17521 [Pyricularia oryzae 70-15]EHA49377.1 hypothetical protein MGG_17521 [Pyricularia oryzae 70-15]